jgi:hypothetical protein
MVEFPATECSCERLFCHVRNLIHDFRQGMSAETFQNLLWIRRQGIWNQAPRGHLADVTLRLENAIEDCYQQLRN